MRRIHYAITPILLARHWYVLPQVEWIWLVVAWWVLPQVEAIWLVVALVAVVGDCDCETHEAEALKFTIPEAEWQKPSGCLKTSAWSPVAACSGFTYILHLKKKLLHINKQNHTHGCSDKLKSSQSLNTTAKKHFAVNMNTEQSRTYIDKTINDILPKPSGIPSIYNLIGVFLHSMATVVGEHKTKTPAKPMDMTLWERTPWHWIQTQNKNHSSLNTQQEKIHWQQATVKCWQTY